MLEPAFTALPSISGTATVGYTLTASPGTVTGFPVPTVSYQWTRNGQAIAGATSSTYLLVDADAGTAVSVIVSAVNSRSTARYSPQSLNIATGGGTIPALGPTTAAFTAGVASGTLIALITGLQAGETITGVTPNDGRLAIAGSGTQLVVGLSASSAGSIAAVLTSSTGRTLNMAITVNAAVVRVRQIASAVRVPGFNGSALSNGTDTTANFVSAHWNESGATLTELATIDVGWTLDSNNESDLTDDFTITRAISYPFNTTVVAVMQWSGSTSKTIAAASQVNQSDWATLSASIPPDAKFGVHTYITVASGKKYPTCGTGSTALGERKETGTGLADKTQSLNVALALSGSIYRPSAVLSRGSTLRNSVAGWGDSIMAAATDGFFGARGGIGAYGRAAEGVIPFQHLGYSGTQALFQAQANKLDRRKALAAASGITHVVLEWIVNDLSQTAAAVQTSLNTIWASVAGLVNVNGETVKAVQTTCTPSAPASPIDKWQTLAGQTVGVNTAKRTTLNNAIRLKPSPLYDVMLIGDAVESALNSDLWGVGATFSPTHLKDPVAGTVGSGSTTTSVTHDQGGTINQWQNGYVKFTSGALAGTAVSFISASANTTGTLTVGALASAPVAGDTIQIFPSGSQPTTDGLHPSVVNLTGAGYGAVFIAADVARAKFQSYA